jgi:DNA-binding NarL/FixJ family response regulator
MNKPNKIRVLIGDRQPIFRSGLNQLLSRAPGIAVVGEAEDSDEAVKLIDERKPSIVILDSLMVETNGRDLLLELQSKYKDVRVIVLTPSDREHDLRELLRNKTAGVVPKQASLEVLLQCIQKVDAGEVWTEPAQSAIVGENSSRSSQTVSPGKDPSPLSLREKQVVSLVSQGFRNKEIAERMFISEQTVKNHLHNIFDKLGVSDRLELALYAIHKNLQTLE